MPADVQGVHEAIETTSFAVEHELEHTPTEHYSLVALAHSVSASHPDAARLARTAALYTQARVISVSLMLIGLFLSIGNLFGITPAPLADWTSLFYLLGFGISQYDSVAEGKIAQTFPSIEHAYKKLAYQWNLSATANGYCAQLVSVEHKNMGSNRWIPRWRYAYTVVDEQHFLNQADMHAYIEALNQTLDVTPELPTRSQPLLPSTSGQPQNR